MNALLPACLVALSTPLGACEVRSGPLAPVVVELYTSEGCNSCPPADRWLSTLKGRTDVLPLAFHVDYWDRLGWVDRFASATHTERQQLKQRGSGARFIYTPQVLANGMDWRRWPSSLPAPRPSQVEVVLSREGRTVHAHVAPRGGAAMELAGYWAVVEHGLVSRVKAGENAGATLHHDHVVRAYRPVPAWRGTQMLTFDAAPEVAGREVVFVVEEAATGRPLQAAALAC
jgi:hypothetical protein